eukprot:TRINITY_DN64155_c0_g1_i1.p1 TRINITY_DN64155_c0_g1~~TRINITY_DN64155_c0_g1_i1.p1  ORF type:complete len:280 (+),score=16.83 TRINITY_DN64155_c0_g1_i1:38-877(+)
MANDENQACPNDLFAVTVSNLTGKSLETSMHSSATVQDVMLEVEKCLGISPRFQTLVHNGRLLDSHESVQLLVEQGTIQLMLVAAGDRLFKHTKVLLHKACWKSQIGAFINLYGNGTCLLLEVFDDRGTSSRHSGWHKTDIVDVLYGTYSEGANVVKCSWEKHYQRKRWIGVDRTVRTPGWVSPAGHNSTVADSGWERMAPQASFKWSRIYLGGTSCWQEVMEASDYSWPADGSSPPDTDRSVHRSKILPPLFQQLVGSDLKMCLPAELLRLFEFEDGK